MTPSEVAFILGQLATPALVFALGEIGALGAFYLIRQRYGEQSRGWGFVVEEAFKGLLERFIIVLGLMLGYAGILTVFAALKLANRLSHEQKPPESEISNPKQDDRVMNYFLIGNLTSVLICLLVVLSLKAINGTVVLFDEAVMPGLNPPGPKNVLEAAKLP